MTPSVAATGSAPPAGKPDPKRVKDAVEQFESILLTQLLRTMHESGTAGWLGGEDDAAAESALSMAEEHFARALAARGGLGLATLIARGFEQRAPAPQALQDCEAHPYPDSTTP